jgi:hypothetical protein
MSGSEVFVALALGFAFASLAVAGWHWLRYSVGFWRRSRG